MSASRRTLSASSSVWSSSVPAAVVVLISPPGSGAASSGRRPGPCWRQYLIKRPINILADARSATPSPSSGALRVSGVSPLPDDFQAARLADVDPAIADVLERALHRQQNTLEMIASENFVPQAVLEATGSVLTNKYAEGYPGRRYYAGCEEVDVAEQLA